MARFPLTLVALAAVLCATPASAMVQVIGNNLAVTCYRNSIHHQYDAAAVRDCDRALEEEGLTRRDRAATYVNRGIIHMQRGNLDRAMTDFDTAIRTAPNLAEGHLNRGVALMRRGDYDAAITSLSQSIELTPEEPALAFYNRGVAYEEVGNVRAAYRDLQRATELQPEWGLARQELARFRVG